MSEKLLQIPLTESDVRSLKVGDVIYLKGLVFTARDMAHLRIKEYFEENKEMPVDFNGSAIFHAGPVARKKEDGSWELVVIGPTTSTRMEPYADMVGKLGVRAIIGKGGMMDATIEKAKEYGYVYLQAAPGCGVTTTEGFEKIEGVEWLDLAMPEALWKISEVHFGPLVVAMDSHNRSIYKEITENALQKVAKQYE